MSRASERGRGVPEVLPAPLAAPMEPCLPLRPRPLRFMAVLVCVRDKPRSYRMSSLHPFSVVRRIPIYISVPGKALGSAPLGSPSPLL